MTDLHAAAVAVWTAWADAFAAADAVRLAALYAPDVQFWGSTAQLYTDAEGVRRYFLTLPPGYTEARFAEPAVLALGPDVFSASGNVVFARSVDGRVTELRYRMTQVFARCGEGWRIAVHHASPQPG